MSKFEKHLVSILKGHDAESVVTIIVNSGIFDTTICRAAIARHYVSSLYADGMGKVDAMFAAAEYFGCSYECIRKYVYYYANANLKL